LLHANPAHAKAHNLLGAACATARQLECARAGFENAIQINPRDPTSYVNLGALYLEIANPTAAADYFAEALTLDPKSPSARDGLARANALRPDVR
jgi:Flp pilus assembly protein TadD